MVLRRAPDRDDVVSILEETHSGSYRIVRATAEAVIAGSLCPWIDDSFHDFQFRLQRYKKKLTYANKTRFIMHFLQFITAVSF